MKSLKFFSGMALLLATASVLICGNTSVAAQSVLSFSGHEWKVRPYGASRRAPGPNYYSDSRENAWVDEKGQLHLKIVKKDGNWYCVEVVCDKSLGYGTYTFYLASRVDRINENAILGLFTWSDSPEYDHREVEFEFSRWGNPLDDNAQCVVQPYEVEGNMSRFSLDIKGDYSTHIITWKKDYINFLSLRGDNPVPADEKDRVFSWKYTGRGIPVPGNENVRMNLWLFHGQPPSDEKEVEVIIKRFEWRP